MSNLSIKQLLGNATGAYTRQVAPRYAIKAQFELMFNNLIRNKDVGEFEATAHITGAEQVRVWVKVPSSKYKTVRYDVVFDLDFEGNGIHFRNANTKMFLNSPAWVYTYAYVANSQDYVIEDLKEYINEAALNDEPKTTNPSSSFGFEKITYFALLYLTEVKRMRIRTDFKRLTKRGSEFSAADIENFATDEKQREYNDAKAIQVTKNAALRKREKAAKIIADGINDQLKRDGNLNKRSKVSVAPRKPKLARTSKPARTAKAPRKPKPSR